MSEQRLEIRPRDPSAGGSASRNTSTQANTQYRGVWVNRGNKHHTDY